MKDNKLFLMLRKHSLVIFQYVFLTIIIIFFLNFSPFQEKRTTNLKPTTNKSKQATKININYASLDEINKVSYIDDKNALKIFNNRPYESVEELIEKKIITKTLFDKIIKYIEV